MKLSIITINYNNLKGLSKTLESTVNQNFKEFEHIVIDGASNDGSVKLIQENQNRFAYWISEPDHGIYHAINKGIKNATGEYLLILNSGDLLYSKDTLSCIIEFLRTGYDIYYGHTSLINDPCGIKTLLAPQRLSFQFFEKTNLVHQSVIIKRELHERVGLYDETLKIVSDWKFYLDAILNGKASWKKIDCFISQYDRTGLSSTAVDLLLAEKDLVLQRDYPFLVEKFDFPPPKNIFRRIFKTILPYGIVDFIQKRNQKHER